MVSCVYAIVIVTYIYALSYIRWCKKKKNRFLECKFIIHTNPFLFLFKLKYVQPNTEETNFFNGESPAR